MLLWNNWTVLKIPLFSTNSEECPLYRCKYYNIQNGRKFSNIQNLQGAKISRKTVAHIVNTLR